MATYDAIRVLGEALMALMRESCPLGELDLTTQAAFALTPLPTLAGTTAPPPGFHLSLWRVSVGTTPRNLPPRRTPSGVLKRPSLPVDLHYMLSAIASDGPKQARMLGWMLRFMHDWPVLSGETINRYVPGARNVFAEHESVELIADPLPVADYLALWDRTKSTYHGGMTYVARMVPIDSDVVEVGNPPVSERIFNVHRVEEP